jgi:L-asparaginase II
MPETHYHPIFEMTRGETVESVHFGSLAVVDSRGHSVAGYGDPDAITFMRSSSKPLQVLPLLQKGGKQYFGLSQQEIALMCASHSGTVEHLAILRELQGRLGISEEELLCGTHLPYDKPSAEKLQRLGIEPTPNYHNCSGNHTGMLAFARFKIKLQPSPHNMLLYVDIDHPVQKDIVRLMAEMSELPTDQIHLGIDGCSAPNFALPLSRAAYAFARLCDPITGAIASHDLAAACTDVVAAMMTFPFLVAGPGRFDTRLMEVTKGRIISKSGAEGYQAIGLLPGAIEPGSQAMGITIKISDGDLRGIVKTAVALEVLRQLDALNEDELALLSEYGPSSKVRNLRNQDVGVSQPIFELSRN